MVYDGLTLLINQLNSIRNAHIIVLPNNGSISVEEYYKWINYKPLNWNRDKLLDKNCLTKKEKDIIKIIKLEDRVRPSFINYLSETEKTTSQSALDIYLFMSKVSIFDYARLKLTEEEMSYCCNRISEYINNDIGNSIKEFGLLNENSMADCFIKYYINSVKLCNDCSISDKTNNEIKNFKKTLK